ncbi:MAG: hypothetical protein NXI10_12430 [bacterium]|nr:hypothetical protein [bacterium]
MVRILLIVLLTGGVSCFAQRGENRYILREIPASYRLPGLISASATFAPSMGIGDGLNSYHLHGFAEYHLSRNVSLKSDSYLLLNRPLVTFYNDEMFRSYFGAFYHLNNNEIGGNWDVKFGLLPGVTYLKRTPWITGEDEDAFTRSLAPSVSLAVGFDYYVWTYFHFFSQVSYVHSNVRGLPNGSQQLDEIIFSAGLGFQIPTRR